MPCLGTAHVDDYVERKDRMGDSRPIFTTSRAVEDMQHMRLMALLGELVRDKGVMKAAKALDVDYRTLTGSLERQRLSKRMRTALERALLEGGGTPAAEQRARNDKLEARLDKMQGQIRELREELRGGLGGLNKLSSRLERLEGQVKEMRDTLPSDVKRLRMSLDGVLKYYGVQRRLIDQRLVALEAGGEGTDTGAPAGDECGGSRSSGVVPFAGGGVPEGA